MEAIWFTDGWSQKAIFEPFLDKRRKVFCGRGWIFSGIREWFDRPGHSEPLTLLTIAPNSVRIANSVSLTANSDLKTR